MLQWLLPLQRVCHDCREDYTKVNVWTLHRDKKEWPLQRGCHCKEVAISRGLPLVSCENKAQACLQQLYYRTSLIFGIELSMVNGKGGHYIDMCLIEFRRVFFHQLFWIQTCTVGMQRHEWNLQVSVKVPSPPYPIP